VVPLPRLAREDLLVEVLKLVYRLPLWLVGYAASLVLYLLGWVVVPTLSLLHRVRLVPRPDGSIAEHWRDGWAYPWDNDEDGVAGPAHSSSPPTQKWVERWRSRPAWLRRIAWALFRNPVGNERHIPLLSLVLDRNLIEWLGNTGNPHWSWKYGKRGTQWCWARQGWYSGLWILHGWSSGKYSEIRLGWAVYPGFLRPIDSHVAMKITLHILRSE